MVSTERWGCWCCEHYVPGTDTMVCRFQRPCYPYGPERGCADFQPLLPAYGNPTGLRRPEAAGSTDED